MGVESDRLVFDYLSRVGDLAQTAMPAADRMRLVAQLRQDIDRERGSADSPAAVRRILGRYGTPDEVVEAAAGSSGGAGGSGSGADEPYREPPPGSYGPYARGRDADGRPRGVPRWDRETSDDGSGNDGGADTTGGTRRTRAARNADDAREPRDARGDRTRASLRKDAADRGDRGGRDSGTDRAGADDADGPQVPRPRADRRGSDADWWRTGGGPGAEPGIGGFRTGDEIAGLPGMTGGVFIPVDDEELTGGRDDDGFPLRKRVRPAPAQAPAEDDAEEEDGYEEEAAPKRPRRRLLPGLLSVGRGWGSPTLLLAAALLLVGAVIGSLIPLGLGWLTAYLSRALSRPQAKFAVLFVPGATALGLVVWVWGRNAGKWGSPIAQGHVGDAFKNDYPTAIRIAAVATALYLLWRSRRTA